MPSAILTLVADPYENTSLGIITPDFSPPTTISQDLNRKFEEWKNLVTHIGVVDKDVLLPKGFYNLPEQYPDADIIAVKMVPSSKTFLLWEAVSFWIALKPRIRDCAVIYSVKFLTEQGGFPDSITPGTILQMNARNIAIADLEAVHNQSFDLKHSIIIQLRDGQSRARMKYSFWKTLLHSVFRLRPLVLYAYIREILDEQSREMELIQENVW